MGGLMPTYGTNLKRIRGQRKQEHLAKAAGQARQANLPTYENDNRFPTPNLVRKHAAMMECPTEALMFGVVTDYDRVRWPDLTDAQLEGLLGGVSAMSRQQRVALSQAGAKSVAASLAQGATKQVPESSPATLATASRTDRGRKQA